MLLSARPLRALGWAVAVPAAVLLAAPAAFMGALQFWKREVRFGEYHWRYRIHVQDSALAHFPLVDPVGPPLFTQRITSGWGTYVDVTYRTKAQARTVLGQVARNCPDESWARRMGDTPPAQGMALACGPILFTTTPAGEELAVSAFLSD